MFCLPRGGNRQGKTHGDARVWVAVEHPVEQVPRRPPNLIRHLESANLDLLEENLDVLIVERQPAREKREENDTAGPDIGRGTVVRFTRNNLRARVVRASAGRLEELFTGLPGGHAKISNLDVLVLVEKEVLRPGGVEVSWLSSEQAGGRGRRANDALQIAVADVEPMTIVDSVDELLEVMECLGRGESSP